MAYNLGIALIIYGIVQLILNESIVQWKRWMKPWWRDDTDPANDAKLADLLRVSTFVVSVAAIECGLYLSGLDVGSPVWHLLVYVVFAVIFWSRRRATIRMVATGD